MRCLALCVDCGMMTSSQLSYLSHIILWPEHIKSSQQYLNMYLVIRYWCQQGPYFTVGLWKYSIYQTLSPCILCYVPRAQCSALKSFWEHKGQGQDHPGLFCSCVQCVLGNKTWDYPDAHLEKTSSYSMPVTLLETIFSESLFSNKHRLLFSWC